jgi:hypothetical protein
MVMESHIGGLRRILIAGWVQFTFIDNPLTFFVPYYQMPIHYLITCHSEFKPILSIFGKL